MPMPISAMKYDGRNDVLHIFFPPPVPSESNEIYPGIFVRRSEVDDRISGVVIMDYSKRDKSLLQNLLPFIDIKELNELRLPS